MTGGPVTLSRATAEALAAYLEHERHECESCDANGLGFAAAELAVTLSGAAEAAAWEPFVPNVAALAAGNAALTPRGASNVEQLLALVRDRFRGVAISVNDPLVLRTMLMTISVTSEYASQIRDAGLFTLDQYVAVTQAGHPVALAVSRLIPDEVLHP